MQDGEDNMELSFASVADHFRYPHSKPCHRLMGKKNNIVVLALCGRSGQKLVAQQISVKLQCVLPKQSLIMTNFLRTKIFTLFRNYFISNFDSNLVFQKEFLHLGYCTWLSKWENGPYSISHSCSLSQCFSPSTCVLSLLHYSKSWM